MDNEINPLAKHSQHFSKYAMFYGGNLFFEDVRIPTEERRSLLKEGFSQPQLACIPLGVLRMHTGKRTIWGYINDILLITRMDRNLVPVVHSPRCSHFRMETRDEQLDTAEGYFLAGRGLPGVVIAGSLLLTNLSAEQLVGLNGQSWKTNMGPIAWEVGSMFTLLVLAYYFLPKYLKMGAMTIPSLMEERYGKGTKTMFSLVIVVMYSILNLPVILLLRCSRFRADLRHLRHPRHQQVHGCCILCLIIGIIGGCYAIFGGLKAVAVSDTINGIGLSSAV